MNQQEQKSYDFCKERCREMLTEVKYHRLTNGEKYGLDGIEACQQHVIEDGAERIDRLESAGFVRTEAFRRVTSDWPIKAGGLLAFNELATYQDSDGYGFYSSVMRSIAEETGEL